MASGQPRASENRQLGACDNYAPQATGHQGQLGTNEFLPVGSGQLPGTQLASTKRDGSVLRRPGLLITRARCHKKFNLFSKSIVLTNKATTNLCEGNFIKLGLE